MKLYHGSNVEVKNPNLQYSTKTTDFGQGFYLTSDYEQSKIWANKKTLKLKGGKPTISVFEFDENDINDLKVKRFDSASEEWFDYVVKNRCNMNSNIDYDIVIGPVANDGTYEVINLYIRGILTREQAILQLKTYKLKDQYIFKTDKSLMKLIYKGVSK